MVFDHPKSELKVKLIDFGLSAICEEGNARFTNHVGTPLYLAPEQIN